MELTQGVEESKILTQNGWTVDRLRLGNTRWLAASKEYETIVGPRQAVVYCNGKHFTAEYRSEGGNILATLRMPLGGDIVVFLASVEKEINDNVFRRLFLEKK